MTNLLIHIVSVFILLGNVVVHTLSTFVQVNVPHLLSMKVDSIFCFVFDEELLLVRLTISNM